MTGWVHPGLEDVVSKRCDKPYLSGTRCGRIKTKTKAWSEVNKDRWRLFERAMSSQNARVTTLEELRSARTLQYNVEWKEIEPGPWRANGSTER
jgi:hypothetical protein